MTNRQKTKKSAEKAGKADFISGKPANAQSHGAQQGSQWDKWYQDAYYKEKFKEAV